MNFDVALKEYRAASEALRLAGQRFTKANRHLTEAHDEHERHVWEKLEFLPDWPSVRRCVGP